MYEKLLSPEKRRQGTHGAMESRPRADHVPAGTDATNPITMRATTAANTANRIRSNRFTSDHPALFRVADTAHRRAPTFAEERSPPRINGRFIQRLYLAIGGNYVDAARPAS